MACLLKPADCFNKYVVAKLPVIARANGWYSMRCPAGSHGQPLRLHTGDQVHISYADLGHCAEPEIYAWLIKQGVPRGCLKRPKAWTPPERAGHFGSDDGKLADVIIAEAFGDGTPTERMIRMTVLALGEVPEGPVVEVLADKLGLTPRMIWKATSGLRKRNRQTGCPAGMSAPSGRGWQHSATGTAIGPVKSDANPQARGIERGTAD